MLDVYLDVFFFVQSAGLFLLRFGGESSTRKALESFFFSVSFFSWVDILASNTYMILAYQLI